MTRKTRSALDAARSVALEGDAASALPVIRAAADGGDAGASASLAELQAFAWHWDDVVEHAGRLVADPFSVYAGNVFDDMVRLLARAGRETGRWKAIAAIARDARLRIGARLDANDDGWHESKIDAARYRLLTICDRLADFAETHGDPPRYDRLDFFNLPSNPPDRANYDLAVVKMAKRGLQHRFAMAISFGVEDEAIRLGEMPEITVSFDHAVWLAKALCRCGKSGEAWNVLETAWPRWSPVDRSQVAPTVLLGEDLFRSIVSADRAAALLATPRAEHLWHR